jgi:hypothetical protein
VTLPLRDSSRAANAYRVHGGRPALRKESLG